MTERQVGAVDCRMAPYPAVLPSAPAHGELVWNGGAVIACPLIYATFWGSHWSDAAHQAKAARLVQFLKDLVASTWMNILSQYGAGTGKGSGLLVQESTITGVPANLTDATIHSVLQGAIKSGAIPEPPANNTTNVIIIYLDESVTVKDSGFGGNAFGYHSDFATIKGNNCYYAVIPALDETSQTQVTSQEFAGMITDPKFPSGWVGSSSSETGAICNGESATITVGPNTWNVQKIYSKADDICLSSAPNPIPRLAGGPPASATTSAISPARFAAYESLLPLPPSQYDHAIGKSSWDPAKLQSYMRRLVYPLDHSNVFAN